MSDWTYEEVLSIVKDYFEMLIKDLSNADYNKSKHRRNLMNFLTERSEGSIEFKHQNISAVLIELGLPYIPGYKPRANYQALLKQAVEDYLIANPNIETIVQNFANAPITPPDLGNILSSEVDVPKFEFKVNERKWKNDSLIKRNYYKEELKNSRLGILGEQFVLSYEKQKLISVGRENLARKIEHISQTKGDSAGYDILSFDEKGNEQFIEVKTTQMGKEAPFYYTRNELGLSQIKNNSYRLYRVFNFKKKPLFYQLSGALDKSCESISTEFLAWPR